ncbi:hypothetical protein I3843_12G109400 [Carya illinoinensis]|uniref:B-box zinc finger protein 22-like n=1 Tax=Carya illinoinensis TaxID=32201 RepID=UPI001BF4B4AD|nr:B-box zinc finger protein 22-like [Carya illinoinensis]KAG2677642.1 hypothetical protein I3760_12G107500 [Carya illinoinensis]KAG7953422.1 hypothetical protein I3843_12G109400 [Carya illinoinensis]
MKIQCNVCEAAEAAVLCCADEAALCWACDEKIHSANKLAIMHQRVPLSSSSSQIPKCDICQETVGYFFCLEDRALLCRKCDVAIHTANAYVSTHQRFLLTGVKVGLEFTKPVASSSSVKASSREKVLETKAHSGSRRDSLSPSAGQSNEVLPSHVGGVGDFAAPNVPYTGGSVAGVIPQWPIDEYLGLPEFNQIYGCMDNGSSKADRDTLGDSDSPFLRACEELEDEECLGQVPEASWAVPQVPSPPTASGLHQPKNSQNLSEGAVFVPDMSHLRVQNPMHCQHNHAL